jgi:DNA-binding PadR family transcriptional regulator
MTAGSVSAKELFVLGRLSMRPTHGHEIMHTLAESRADLWVELSEKHVYYILKKLERDGLVSVEVQRDGARPARKVYSVTPEGLRAFERLMGADGFIESVPYSEFDVVFGMLAYTDRLGPAEKIDVLERRAAHLRALMAEASEASERAGASGVLDLPARVFDKIVRVADAELRWLDEVLAVVKRDGWTSARRGDEKPAIDVVEP